MQDYNGEKFLDKLYSNLYMSDEVQHTRQNTDKRYESIRRYLERLERIHSKANTKTKKELIRSLYYDKYIIDEETLKNKILEEQGYANMHELNNYVKLVVDSQKKSLDKWLDYLTDKNSIYPLWAKYWAFQGMLKMGTYDEGIEGYQKRSKDTEAPFIDANPEIIAKAISIVQKIVNKESLDDNELEKLCNSGNFSKIYTILEKKYKDNVIEYSGTDGIWIKYEKGSREDAKKLSASLQGKNTHWCTADESTAIEQVCGPYDTADGGDFYVYYTKDKKGNYTLPRIAIRMIDHTEIGEIRGILEGQNLEEEMIPILDSKLNEMQFLDKKTNIGVFEKINNLKELSNIYKKTIQNKPLTKTEIKNLYSKQYGFGLDQDPKVDKTIKKRDRAHDFNSIDDYKTKAIIYEIMGTFKNEYHKLKLDNSFVERYIKTTKRIEIMQYVNPDNISNYEKLIYDAVNCIGKTYGSSLMKYIKPEYVSDYEKIVKIIIEKNPESIEFVNPNYVTNYEELATQAVNMEPSAIIGIKIECVTNYGELATQAVKREPYAINGINIEYVTNYEELATYAVNKEANLIRDVNADYLTNYEELATIAVNKDAYLIESIKADKVSNYDNLVKHAISQLPEEIEFIDIENIDNYDEIAKLAIEKDPNTIDLIQKEDVKNYEELAKTAIILNESTIQYIKPKDVSNYEELARISALNGNMYGIDPKHVSNYEELANLAVEKDPFSIRHLKLDYIKDYDSLIIKGIKQNYHVHDIIEIFSAHNYKKIYNIYNREKQKEYIKKLKSKIFK